MSLDIDMQSYAGEETDSAAVNQEVAETNFYLQESGNSPSHPELLDKTEKPLDEIEKNPQAEHFAAFRKEVDQLKAEREADRKEHQLQLEMLRANVAATQRPQDQPRTEMFNGMKEDDVPNVGELRKEWAAREANYQARLEELQVQQMHPDYAEVIEKFALPLVRQKPHLAEGLHGASNKALFAYEIGKMAQQMQEKPAAQQRSESAQRMVENSRKPGTLSQAGGQSALSQADHYATMSDQEFMRMASRHLDSI